MKQSEAWLLQVKSDFKAAEVLYDNAKSEPLLRCQAIAKYQQVAEKCVKALVASVTDIGVQFMTVTTDPVPRKEIDALLERQRALDNASLKFLRDTILSDKRKIQIIALCEFAPRHPGPNKPLPRNTEYPFNPEAGATADWQAPAADGVFTLAEVEAARQLAWVLPRNTAKFVSGMRRGRIKPEVERSVEWRESGEETL